jgi:hypothetical protein
MIDTSWRLIALYPHLIACCIALGGIILSDAKFILSKGQLSDADRIFLLDLSRIVSFALVVLWLTGLSIIAIDFAHWPSWSELLAKPKLIAKLIVVCILSLNGYLLHRIVLPTFTEQIPLASIETRRLRCMFVLGAISGTSWLFAAFLGIAKPLSAILGLSGFMAMYAALMIGAVSTALLLANKVKSKPRRPDETTQFLTA